jgi:hypothetical protein
MNTFSLPEKDTLEETPHKRRHVGLADARRPKQVGNDLTCNEADVDDLLSTGELT